MYIGVVFCVGFFLLNCRMVLCIVNFFLIGHAWIVCYIMYFQVLYSVSFIELYPEFPFLYHRVYLAMVASPVTRS